MAASINARLNRIVVLAWGNPSRGDDGLGPALVHQLESVRGLHTSWPSLHLMAFTQLQPEHMLELEGGDAALFADAAIGLDEPYVFQPITAAKVIQANTHEFTPAELLRTYEHALGTPPPPSWVLKLAGCRFELDAPLSAEAGQSLAAAIDFVEWIFDHPTRDDWLEAVRRGQRRGS